jgi:DNA-directed RNA polymerase II subunit RPB2
MRPAIIFNPHGIPSRMTCAQLIESLMGNLCAIKGTFYDATMFKKVDIESIAEELEQYGYDRYGYERMMSGITGEYMDTLIFFGPTYYQRLQKFVADAEYSVRHALTDAVTQQPLDGQGSSGGLRIGEMEKDVLVSHGSSRFLNEKFTNHSDGYTEYICRCGKPAIVNHAENIYKCKYCKDNADITAVPTTWTSKLFMQEMESMNVGIRRLPRPFTYEIADDVDRTYSQVDPYNADSIEQLHTIMEDSIDNAVGNIATED